MNKECYVGSECNVQWHCDRSAIGLTNSLESGQYHTRSAFSMTVLHNFRIILATLLADVAGSSVHVAVCADPRMNKAPNNLPIS